VSIAGPQTAVDVGTVTSSSVGSATVTATTGATIVSTNPSSQQVGGQSQGIELSISKDFTFSASHQLPSHPGKCKNLHGHNYKVRLTMTGELDTKTRMVEDFYTISEQFKESIDRHFDHAHLNDHFTEPTAEVIACYILGVMRAYDKRYTSVTVWETDDCFATATHIER